MKFTTIWTIKGMALRERVNRTVDLVAMKVAARLPKRIAYWSYIHQGVRYIEDSEIVPDVRYTEILARLGKAY